jgi:hypothetical protein
MLATAVSGRNNTFVELIKIYTEGMKKIYYQSKTSKSTEPLLIGCRIKRDGKISTQM